MKYLLLLACLILCFCSSREEETKRENDVVPVCSLDDLPPNIAELCSRNSSVEPNKPPDDVQFEQCPSPSLKGSVNPDPLIRECPQEDIAMCPIREPDWPWVPILSLKELSFGKQGGIKCLTSSPNLLYLYWNYGKDNCRSEEILVSDSINDPPHFIGINSFKRLICPWFIATRVSQQVVHISVDKNETGKERKMNVLVSGGNSGNNFTITQSAE